MDYTFDVPLLGHQVCTCRILMRARKCRYAFPSSRHGHAAPLMFGSAYKASTAARPAMPANAWAATVAIGATPAEEAAEPAAEAAEEAAEAAEEASDAAEEASDAAEEATEVSDLMAEDSDAVMDEASLPVDSLLDEAVP